MTLNRISNHRPWEAALLLSMAIAGTALAWTGEVAPKEDGIPQPPIAARVPAPAGEAGDPSIEGDGKPVAAHAKGLLFGSYDPKETPARTREERDLGLRPHPGLSQVKPFWLYAPSSYVQEKPMPLVIVWHRRGGLRGFSTTMEFGMAELKSCTLKDLSAWKGLAEQENFLLLVPLGDPDILGLGMSWFTGDRSRLLASQIETVCGSHQVDRSRVYVVASGEGAHAALATSIRHGGLIAAVAGCNPPLFDGSSRQGGVIYPETVSEMLKAASGRKVPMLVLAGILDQNLKVTTHSISGLKATRFEDSSRIPAEHVKRMVALLQQAGFPVESIPIPTRHFAGLPEEQARAVWEWLRKHSIPAPEQVLASTVLKQLDDSEKAVPAP